MATPVVEIERIIEPDGSKHLPQFIALLCDAVDNGASIGFLRPMNTTLARDYWTEVFQSVARGTRVLLAAHAEGKIIGSVQLDLCMKPNGAHRAEVQKLLVLTANRRQGIATRLMEAVEIEARSVNRSVLFLDTEAGSGAEHFYDSQHWLRVGSIPSFALSADGIPTPNIIYCKTS